MLFLTCLPTFPEKKPRFFEDLLRKKRGGDVTNDKSFNKSKLFKLKKWLTIPETADHLSIVFGENVKEADVLRLALDGHLRLSVNFVNHANARRGEKMVPFDDWKKKFREEASWDALRAFPGINGMLHFAFPESGKGFAVQDEELVNDDKSWKPFGDESLKVSFLEKKPIESQKELLSNVVNSITSSVYEESQEFNGMVPPPMDCFQKNVITIDGLWDLPMLGGESLDVEHAFQMQTNGPEVTLCNIDGAFVQNEEGIVYQLQERFDKEHIKELNSEEYEQKSLDFYKEHLEKKVLENKIDQSEVGQLLAARRENIRKPRDRNDDFYPAGGLPEDSVLVVRTKSLVALQEQLSEDFEQPKEMSLRSETTYQNIIAALLDCISGNLPGVEKHPSFPSEAKLIEAIDHHFDGYSGLSKSNLSRKFPEAKRALQSQ